LIFMASSFNLGGKLKYIIAFSDYRVQMVWGKYQLKANNRKTAKVASQH
jgi:hypothetical protein